MTANLSWPRLTVFEPPGFEGVDSFDRNSDTAHMRRPMQ